jgi:hypothetical protein
MGRSTGRPFVRKRNCQNNLSGDWNARVTEYGDGSSVEGSLEKTLFREKLLLNN